MLPRHDRKSWRITVFIGLGLCAYSWYQWNSLPVPSEDELNFVVESRYQDEIARMQERSGGAPVPINQEWQDKFHTAIRTEQMRPFEDQKRVVYGFLALGLITTIIGIGSFISQRFEKPVK